MKVFRKVTPGANPDITVHAELTRAESEHIAALYGWLEATDPARPGRRGAPARDAPGVPAHRHRRLRARAGQRPVAVRRRQDWRTPTRRTPAVTSPPRRPGSARRCARCTRRCAPTSRPRPAPPSATAELAAQMADRLDAAIARRARPGAARRRAAHGVRPGRLARTGSTSSRSTATCTSARRCAPRRAGRSSTSRASRPSRWPSASCPDSPWRDVAGMLRSFDYAPRVVERAMTEGERPADDAHDFAQEGGAMGRTEQEPLPDRLRRWGAQLGRTDLAGRVRRGQGRLRDRLRDPQPPDLARRPAPGRGEDRSRMTPTPHPHHRSPSPPTSSPCSSRGEHGSPHAILGPHPHDGGVTVRAFKPLARTVVVRHGDGTALPARARARGHLGRRPPGRRRARTTGSRSPTTTGPRTPSTTPTASCRPSARWTCT